MASMLVSTRTSWENTFCDLVVVLKFYFQYCYDVCIMLSCVRVYIRIIVTITFDISY